MLLPHVALLSLWPRYAGHLRLPFPLLWPCALDCYPQQPTEPRAPSTWEPNLENLPQGFQLRSPALGTLPGSHRSRQPPASLSLTGLQRLAPLLRRC
jgi:hypothetical protein